MTNFRILLKTAAAGLGVLVLLWAAAVPAPAAGNGMQGGLSPHKCPDCHTCPQPTPQAQCLRPCLRNWPCGPGNGAGLTPGEAPTVLLLDYMEHLYGPVRFDHRLHADMAQMSAGCVTCHHFTPTGEAHPPCRECHLPQGIGPAAQAPASADLGLKGAYHRQCMGCHREWSQHDDCEVCHVVKAPAGEPAAARMAEAYRPCKEPLRKVYDTGAGDARYVTFFHRNHAHVYGLGCSECHRQDPCVACHYQGEKPVSVVRASADAMHHKCAACHDIQASGNCSKCHSATARTQFSHADATGWALGRYHARLTCASCHPAGGRIARLDRSCDGCHGDWSAENFDHAVVGLTLDENHLDFDCMDCHQERRFDAPPDCGECHEDKAYPKDLPGQRVRPPAQ